jgi:hypothetical protein
LTLGLRRPATVSVWATLLLFVSAKTSFPAGTRFRESLHVREVILTEMRVAAAA